MSRHREADRLRQENIRQHIQREKRNLFQERVQSLQNALDERVKNGGLTKEEREAIYAEGMLQIRLELGLVEDTVSPGKNALTVPDNNTVVRKRNESLPPKLLQAADFIKEGTLVPREDFTMIIHLDDLLDLSQKGEVERILCEVSDIQALLSHEISAKIPDELVKRFGMEGLRWEFIAPLDSDKCLPYLFLGGSRLKDGMVELDSALSTVYADRRVLWTNPNIGEVYGILDVAVAGVDRASNKITAVRYKCSGDMSAKDINVSISELDRLHEYKKWKEMFDGEYFDNYVPHDSVVPIPTLLKHPYYHAGLITKAMADSVSWGKEKGKVLRIGRVLSGGTLEMTETGFISSLDDWQLREQGYFVKADLFSHKVGFAPAHKEDSKLPSWEVSIPRYLQKTGGLHKKPK